jgi:hypothetical protein
VDCELTAATPASVSCGYLIMNPNDAKPHASAPAAPCSWNAEQQQTPETNAGTSGEARTTHADHEPTSSLIAKKTRQDANCAGRQVDHESIKPYRKEDPK